MSSPEQQTLAEWLNEEPFTLAMSSGLFGFYAHAGVLDALSEKELIPEAVRGSSAGALVTASWAAGVEPGKITEELTGLQREDFWDPGFGFGLLRGKLFDQKLRSMLPVADFEECDVTAGVSVFDVLGRRTEVLGSGDLAVAIRASCALPVLFQPVMIDRRPKLDGGMKDRAGLSGAAPDARIFYHRLAPSVSKGYIAEHQDPLPSGPNLKTLQIGGLPKVRPSSLHQGVEAYRIAKAGALHALDQPVPTS